MNAGKLIKEGAEFLCKPIQSLINKCIDTCTFPNALKLADVVPIFKKNDMLNKMNYRPISILSCISKIFEKLLISQLKSLRSENHTPRFHLFNRSIRLYIL